MSTLLLDANVLLALAWPDHQHFQRTIQWFKTIEIDEWATCPMTQCAFVRLSSNPAVLPSAVRPMTAVAALETLIAHPRHRFWEDNFLFTDARFVNRAMLQGYRQVTDAYLLGLCIKHGGRFVTFDKGIASLAPPSEQHRVIVL